VISLRRRLTSIFCLCLTHLRHGQNAFMQSQQNSLNFGSRVKYIPILKLNCDNISEAKTLCFSIITNITFIISFKNNKKFDIFKWPLTFQNLNLKKMQRLVLRNIVTIQFYYKYIYSRTKIEGVLLMLCKSVLSMLYVCKTETTHTGMTSS